jgi:hypothetical protein
MAGRESSRQAMMARAVRHHLPAQQVAGARCIVGARMTPSYFTGTIDRIAPGTAGYEAAAHGRACGNAAGATAIEGPGYGNFKQIELQGVDAGDIVAMKLIDATQGRTYWAFSQATEAVNGLNVGHIWNYGLNTWGWEDTLGGGDRDYNDLVVNLDFTSAYGQAWLL